MLADMAVRGEVTLDTPVQKLLPDSVKVPSRNGKQITLLDLSMHVSGLPRNPTNIHPADDANPFADYDTPNSTNSSPPTRSNGTSARSMSTPT